MSLAEVATGTVRIEADTAEQALAAVHERLGADAEIVDARKVHRGGWRGFFALERVELVARPRGAEPIAPPEPADDGASPSPDGPHEALGLDDEFARDRADFDRMLRQLMAGDAGGPAPAPAPMVSESAAVAPDPAPGPVPVVEPRGAAPAAPRPHPPSGTAGVRWSVDRLAALRIPEPMLDACRGLAAADDTAWVLALADVASSWCRPLPAGVPAYVGPGVARFARALDVPVVAMGSGQRPTGPVALDAPDTPEGRDWAVGQAGERWLHLVASGRRWHAFLFEDVLAVSWTREEHLAAALSAAHRMGLVLGHGMGRSSGSPVRATPLDVAVAIRSLLPRVDA